jgi:hypothetical protein
MFSAGGRGFSIVVVTASIFWSGIYPQGANDTTFCPIHLPPKSGTARRCFFLPRGADITVDDFGDGRAFLVFPFEVQVN